MTGSDYLINHDRISHDWQHCCHACQSRRILVEPVMGGFAIWPDKNMWIDYIDLMVCWGMYFRSQVLFISLDLVLIVVFLLFSCLIPCLSAALPTGFQKQTSLTCSRPFSWFLLVWLLAAICEVMLKSWNTICFEHHPQQPEFHLLIGCTNLIAVVMHLASFCYFNVHSHPRWSRACLWPLN